MSVPGSLPSHGGHDANTVERHTSAPDAGAVAVVIMNNVVGGAAIPLGGDLDAPTITIPTVSLSTADGVTLKSGLPATGTVSRKP
jgi:hypothetical protein